MADAVEHVSNAVVLVNGRERQPASGIVYAPSLILTASHVLERDNTITIYTADKRTLPATLVGRDAASDLAVLRVENLNIEPAQDATENARVGQLTLIVGRSSEEGHMASMGIVSAVGGPLTLSRNITLEQYIRTDAIPYPGFSGSPLIDTQGAVMGILTTGLANSVTLAIPIQLAKQVAGTLVQYGYRKRGYLGIGSQFVQIPTSQRPNSSQEYGLLIVKVDDQSPAQRAGVMIGDILVSLDGHAIKDPEDLKIALTGERVGKVIPLEVIRGNALQTLQVTVGQRN
jgi:S1-C subfamily serine protease